MQFNIQCVYLLEQVKTLNIKIDRLENNFVLMVTQKDVQTQQLQQQVIHL